MEAKYEIRLRQIALKDLKPEEDARTYRVKVKTKNDQQPPPRQRVSKIYERQGNWGEEFKASRLVNGFLQFDGAEVEYTLAQQTADSREICIKIQKKGIVWKNTTIGKMSFALSQITAFAQDVKPNTLRDSQGQNVGLASVQVTLRSNTGCPMAFQQRSSPQEVFERQGLRVLTSSTINSEGPLPAPSETSSMSSATVGSGHSRVIVAGLAGMRYTYDELQIMSPQTNQNVIHQSPPLRANQQHTKSGVAPDTFASADRPIQYPSFFRQPQAAAASGNSVGPHGIAPHRSLPAYRPFGEQQELNEGSVEGCDVDEREYFPPINNSLHRGHSAAHF